AWERETVDSETTISPSLPLPTRHGAPGTRTKRFGFAGASTTRTTTEPSGAAGERRPSPPSPSVAANSLEGASDPMEALGAPSQKATTSGDRCELAPVAVRWRVSTHKPTASAVTPITAPALPAPYSMSMALTSLGEQVCEVAQGAFERLSYLTIP